MEDPFIDTEVIEDQFEATLKWSMLGSFNNLLGGRKVTSLSKKLNEKETTPPRAHQVNSNEENNTIYMEESILKMEESILMKGPENEQTSHDQPSL